MKTSWIIVSDIFLSPFVKLFNLLIETANNGENDDREIIRMYLEETDPKFLNYKCVENLTIDFTQRNASSIKAQQQKITSFFLSSNKQLLLEQVSVSTFSLDTSSNSKYNVFCLSRSLSKKGLVRRSHLQMIVLQLPKRRKKTTLLQQNDFVTLFFSSYR
jgi:hypothetical protein